jgi:CBS domain-containing protein
MHVGDVMTTDVATTRPDDSIVDVARIMRDEDCGGVPVVDRFNRPIGMITDRDVTCRLVADGEDVRRARVDDCMTSDVFACEVNATIGECLEAMVRHQVRRMLVVNGRDELVGIVSQADLARRAERDRGIGERRAIADAVGEISERTDRPYR